MNCTTLGIDLAKQVFQLHGVDEPGQVVGQKRGSRSKLRVTIAQLPACLIPHMRFVPLKTGESQDIQAIHRMRSRLSKERTALVPGGAAPLSAGV